MLVAAAAAGELGTAKVVGKPYRVIGMRSGYLNHLGICANGGEPVNGQRAQSQAVAAAQPDRIGGLAAAADFGFYFAPRNVKGFILARVILQAQPPARVDLDDFSQIQFGICENQFSPPGFVDDFDRGLGGGTFPG